uniref:Uncharacterized protein n=1 Tax=Strigops habroptila TaxID=2489341 RepID=A0A672TZY4_STRHB
MGSMGLEWALWGWNGCYGLEWVLWGWNGFYGAGVGAMGLEWALWGWNGCYGAGMGSMGLEWALWGWGGRYGAGAGPRAGLGSDWPRPQGALPAAVPLAVVYFAEYFINQGVLCPTSPPRAQLLYQAGVFVSRSGFRYLRLRRIWVLMVLQVLSPHNHGRSPTSDPQVTSQPIDHPITHCWPPPAPQLTPSANNDNSGPTSTFSSPISTFSCPVTAPSCPTTPP